jgi:glycosyltransferase involved in cell wall biosynthesis
VFEPPDSVLRGSGVRYDPIGGMQNHTGQLARALARRGIAQTVLTARPPGSPRRQLFAPGVVVRRHGVRLRVLRQLYGPPTLLDAVRIAPSADLVHAHTGEDLAVLPVALAASRVGRAPLVVTIHTSLCHTFHSAGVRTRFLELVGGAIEAWTCGHAEQVIVLTPRLAELLVARGIPAERIHVIPSGVTAADDRPLPDPFPSLPHPRVVFLGRIVRQKGVATLIEAAARMRHEVLLLVVGDGPLRDEAEAAAAAADIDGRVCFAGFRPHREVAAILAHADAFVMPSVYEELGTSLLEAMQAGLPIVASDTGGIPTALGDAGVLVPPGDPDALAAAVDALLDDPGRAARLGAAARARAAAYDWEALADRVLGVYRSALEAAPPGPSR